MSETFIIKCSKNSSVTILSLAFSLKSSYCEIFFSFCFSSDSFWMFLLSFDFTSLFCSSLIFFSSGFWFSLLTLFLIFSLLFFLNTGISSPAESRKIICLPSYPFKSGYLTLKPSVLILVPVGKLNFEILLNKNDFPLLLFPITPIVIKSLSLYVLYFFNPSSLKFIFHPSLLTFFIEFILITIS